MVSEPTTALGRKLRELRRIRGMSQGDLARAMGISQKQLSFWETGRATPQKRFLPRLADALACTTGELDEARERGIEGSGEGITWVPVHGILRQQR